MTQITVDHIHHLLGSRPRLMVGLIIGLVAGLLLPAVLPLPVRCVIGWDIAALVYIAAAAIQTARNNSAAAIQASAARNDQSRGMILAVMTVASFASLIAIATLLTGSKGTDALVAHFHLILGMVTVVSSWTLMHLIFAVHYAHEYYGDVDSSPDNYDAYKGLMFPGDKDPVFSDFLYYSYVVGMTCQVSDVQVASHAMRRLTLAHGFLAFFFNTVVLALSVNIAAGLLS